jgi:UDP-3-O-[3-hydroxymyristoyl] glucosamine N-acyltransferase
MSKYPQKQTSINELVVDYLTLKRAIQGKLVVTETLEVKKNAVFVKNVVVKENANISQNVYAENMYARDSIYTHDIIAKGNLLIQGDSAIAYNNLSVGGNILLQDTLAFTQTDATIHSSGQQNIGINTLTPSSTLDIVGTNPRSLNVFTSNITNLNIIARNNANNGITTFSNTVTSHIGFYNNTTINDSTFNVSSQTPDAKIEYANSGTLSVNAPNSIDMYSRTHITSNRSKSNLTVFNETLAVHGNGSAVPYLWNYYENDNTTRESVATFISGNSYTNTFLNMVAPNKQGVSIGGGEYINDSTRSFGTLGLINSDGEYYPSLTVVSGNSRVKQKFTLGINTHSPKVDAYSVDINGPIQITNGEITPVYHSDFEILTMSFSRKDPLHGVAVGTPTNIAGNTFTYTILYTNTGGESWYTGNLPGGATDFAIFATSFKDSYVYDSSLSIIVGELTTSNNESIILYSRDSGHNWYILKMYAGTVSNDNLFKNIKSVFINDSTVFLAASSQILSVNKASIKIPSFSDIFIDLTADLGNIYVLNLNPGITNLNSLKINGHANRLHLVYGNVIASYNIPLSHSLSQPAYHTNGNNLTYNSISVYDDNHAVAVGNNIISYISGNNAWADVQNHYNYKLNSVYMYDTHFSIAVGNDGTIVYSSDGNYTWNPMPRDILNTSGVSTLISSSKLTHTARVNSNSFIITKNSIPYISGNNTVGRKGDSTIYYCYLPHFLDNANNFVVDVFGSSRFSGDINVYNKGKINSTNDTFYLLNQQVNAIYFGNDATTVSVGNISNSTLTVNHNLNVLNDSSFNRNVTIGGNTYIHKNVTVDQNVNINKKLFVTDDASMDANVDIGQNANIGGVLTVTGDSNMYSKLFVLGDVSMNANVDIGKNANIGGVLTVTGDSNMYSKLFVLGDVSMNAHVDIGKNANIGGVLTVTGDSKMNSKLFVLGDTSMDANVVIVKNANIGGVLTVTGDSKMNSKLFVLGDVSMNARVDIGQNANIGGVLTVTGDSNMYSKLFVSGDASMKADLDVDQNATVGGELTVTGDSKMNSKLFVLGDTSMENNLKVDNTIQSLYYEGPIIGGDIQIGSLPYNAVDAKTERNIYIGATSNPTDQAQLLKTTITLGGPNDTVVIPGGTISISETQYGKLLKLNETGVVGSSAGSGISFNDGPLNKEGKFVVSNDINGFYFKAPKPDNVVKFDVANLISENCILTLFEPSQADEDKMSYNYVIKTSTVDYRNIMQKDHTQNANDTQTITTKVGILDNVFISNALSIGTENNNKNTAESSILHINGSTTQENGYIWQF